MVWNGFPRRIEKGAVIRCVNAFMESCFETIKPELEMACYQSLEHARREIEEFINYYNAIRRHSSLDYQSPTSFELAHQD